RSEGPDRKAESRTPSDPALRRASGPALSIATGAAEQCAVAGRSAPLTPTLSPSGERGPEKLRHPPPESRYPTPDTRYPPLPPARQRDDDRGGLAEVLPRTAGGLEAGESADLHQRQLAPVGGRGGHQRRGAQPKVHRPLRDRLRGPAGVGLPAEGAD